MPLVESNGERYYALGGCEYPSVTTVLRATAPRNFTLEAWRRSLGDAADAVSEIAGYRGKRLHADIDHYRTTGEEPTDPSPWWLSARDYVRMLALSTTRVCGEFAMVSRTMGYGGTPDDVSRVGSDVGDIVVHDWKSAAAPKTRLQLLEIEVQIAGYVELVAEHVGRPTRGVIVVAIAGAPSQVHPVKLAAARLRWRDRLAQYKAQRA